MLLVNLLCREGAGSLDLLLHFKFSYIMVIFLKLYFHVSAPTHLLTQALVPPSKFVVHIPVTVSMFTPVLTPASFHLVTLVPIAGTVSDFTFPPTPATTPATVSVSFSSVPFSLIVTTPANIPTATPATLLFLRPILSS